MTSKERMLRALNLEKPDRVPVTCHQWQQHHLDTFMCGVSELEAFKQCGLDASVPCFEGTGQSAKVNEYDVQNPGWQVGVEVLDSDPGNTVRHYTVTTPGGELSYRTGANSMTTWMTEFIIKRDEDIELIDKYMPVAKVDKVEVERMYDWVGDAGILRGFVWGDQAGCWQHACCLYDTEPMIMACFDKPDWVHRLLGILLKKKLRFIEESLDGTKFDLIETGGGAGSDTVVSPNMHREFCLPYDKKLHDAVKSCGLKVVYHTCGGQMFLGDQILANGCSASETLSPPGCGGNITEPEKVREEFGGKIAMIGGIDQFNVVTSGGREEIRRAVHRMFEGYGRDGGYVMSACDHFFETPVENLKMFGEAARECVY